jgi:LysM repeat protein
MGTIKLLLVALILGVIALAVACDGEESRGPSGSQDLTDPKTAPSTTPWATPPPVVYVEGGPGPSGPSGPSGPGAGTYTVESGDTASDIAAAFGITVDALAEANGMTVEEIANLSVGQELVIPGQDQEEPTPEGTPAASTATATATATVTPAAAGGTYIVEEGDYPGLIAERFGITAEELMDANGITDPTSLSIGQELIIPTPTP